MMFGNGAGGIWRFFAKRVETNMKFQYTGDKTMHINDLKPFTFDADGKIRPWVAPESVTVIDHAARRNG
jgi:hypothetical protein